MPRRDLSNVEGHAIINSAISLPCESARRISTCGLDALSAGHALAFLLEERGAGLGHARAHVVSGLSAYISIA